MQGAYLVGLTILWFLTTSLAKSATVETNVDTKFNMSQEIAELYLETFEGLRDILGLENRAEADLEVSNGTRLDLYEPNHHSDWDEAAHLVSEALRDGVRPSFVQSLKKVYQQRKSDHSVNDFQLNSSGAPSGLLSSPTSSATLVGVGSLQRLSLHREGSARITLDTVGLPSVSEKHSLQEGSNAKVEDSLQSTMSLDDSQNFLNRLRSSDPRRLTRESSKNSLLGANSRDTVSETPEARESRVLQQRQLTLKRFVNGANVTLAKVIAIHDRISHSMKGVATIEVSRFTSAVALEVTTVNSSSRRRSTLLQQQQQLQRNEGSMKNRKPLPNFSSSGDLIGQNRSRTNLLETAGSSSNLERQPSSSMVSNTAPTGVSREVMDPLMFDLLNAYEEPLLEGAESSQVVQTVKRRSVIKTPEIVSSSLSYRQRRVLPLRLVDYRQLLFQMSRACSCGVRDRVALFFKLYGEKGEILIDGLCALLYLGDRIIATSLRDAERFIRSLDQDGDNSVTLDEFQNAIERNPFILENIVRAHVSVQESSELHQQALRAFVHRTSLSWAGMCELWTSLNQLLKQVHQHQQMMQNLSIQEGLAAPYEGNVPTLLRQSSSFSRATFGTFESTTRKSTSTKMQPQDENLEDDDERVLVSRENFETQLCAMLRPPEPDDAQLVSDLSGCFLGRVRPGYVDVRAFVSALGATLGELNVGISDCHYKAKLYFSLHNLDNDGVLTREEIYRMLFTSSTNLGRKILQAASILRDLDADGDGTISQEEFLRAAQKDPRFLVFFQQF